MFPPSPLPGQLYMALEEQLYPKPLFDSGSSCVWQPHTLLAWTTAEYTWRSWTTQIPNQSWKALSSVSQRVFQGTLVPQEINMCSVKNVLWSKKLGRYWVKVRFLNYKTSLSFETLRNRFVWTASTCLTVSCFVFIQYLLCGVLLQIGEAEPNSSVISVLLFSDA